MFDLAKTGPVIIIRLNDEKRYLFLDSAISDLRKEYDGKIGIFSKKDFKNDKKLEQYFEAEKEFFLISERIVFLYFLAHIDYALQYLEIEKNQENKFELLNMSLQDGGSNLVERIFKFHLEKTRDKTSFDNYSNRIINAYSKNKNIGIAIDEFHLLAKLSVGYFLHYDCKTASQNSIFRELIAKQIVERAKGEWAKEYLTDTRYKRNTSILYMVLDVMKRLYNEIPQYLASTSLSTAIELFETENFSRGDFKFENFYGFHFFNAEELFEFLNEHFFIAQDEATQNELINSLSRFVGRGEWFFEHVLKNVRQIDR